jgi:L,D-transpeptidase YcbB
MHDTIKRELLNLTVRAEGHNCPRVANPGKVAAVLLAEDKGMAQAEIDKLLADGYNSGVTLDHHIPVHTTYFTAVVDDQGKVDSFADIYKLDGAITAALLGKDVKASSVADNAPAKAKPPKPGAPAGGVGGAAGSVADSTR